MLPQTPRFPFVAVAGQESFKLALILAAINPGIGGVLIAGPRGCAKSTLARGMADLLPGGSHKFITLPLGTTEEMLLGTLDLQQVLQDQSVAFNPGLLAKSDGGILYVDEVNLLNDNLVDLLLDVAASGINCVERDGISHSHSARFLLVGTMNHDEGELRPQLQDRFGLAVELDNQYAIEERIEIVRRREAFDHDPQAYCASYQAEQTRLLQVIEAARAALPGIHCADALRIVIAERCHQANVEGLRADLIWYRAALAHAAWCGRNEVSEADILAVEELVLSHRRKAASPPTAQPPAPPRQPPPRGGEYKHQQPHEPDKHKASHNDSQHSNAGEWGSMAPEHLQTADSVQLKLPTKRAVATPFKTFAARLATTASHNKGRFAGGTRSAHQVSNKPNWFSTLIASAGQWPPRTLKMKKAFGGQPVLHFVLLDTSASTLHNNLFAQSKAIVLGIAEKAYIEREQMVIWGFGNQQVERFLARVRAPKKLRQLLDNIPAGGGTPLRDGLLNARAYLQKLARQHPELSVQSYLITDGRTSQQVNDLNLPGHCMLIDIEASAVKRGRGQEIASALGADYFPLQPSY